MDDIINIINNLGVPVACLVFLGYACFKFINMMIENNKEREMKLYDLNAKTSEQLTIAQENNAKFIAVLETLQNSIKKQEEDIDDIKNVLNINNRKSDIND